MMLVMGQAWINKPTLSEDEVIVSWRYAKPRYEPDD
jgi:hypothetical protein